MTTPDIIILICFLPAVVRGLSKGFIEQAVALVSVVIGTWMAFRFSTVISKWLTQYLEVSDSVLQVISFALIAIAVILVLFVIGKILSGIVKLIMLGWLDRLLGLVFGILKAGLIIGTVIILFDTINGKFEFISQETLDSTVLYIPVKQYALTIFPYLKELLFK